MLARNPSPLQSSKTHLKTTTTTKICTNSRSIKAHAIISMQLLRLPKHESQLTRGVTLVYTLCAINFQGLNIRQVSLYTLLSGFQLPWPPSCCPNVQTPFWARINVLWHLSYTQGAFLIAGPAYQDRPTQAENSRTISYRDRHCANLEFENQARTRSPWYC